MTALEMTDGPLPVLLVIVVGLVVLAIMQSRK